MKRLTETEFMQYLFSQKDYDDLIYHQRVKLHDMYQDISPTILSIDPSTGLNHKVGQNVENYAITLVDLRHELAEQRTKVYKRLQIYQQALKSLESTELELIQAFRENQLVKQRKEQRMALEKLKVALEPLVFAFEMQQTLLEEERKAKRLESVRQALHFIPKDTEEKKRGYLINGEMRYLTEEEYAAYQRNPNISQYDLVGLQHQKEPEYAH